MNKRISARALHAFHVRLHAWYQAHGRKHLPWRNTDDPYAIYISETMLQQTQVATVLERYYFPFLERFPTLAALAGAPRDAVLQAWAGLGYYNRAANLHETARRCDVALPKEVEGLLALPGIGRNTAHAIAAFAYRQPVAILEANVKRVVARIFALAQPKPAELWDAAHVLLDSANPFDYNQAMMDIGSMVCTTKRPHCLICPANPICTGKAAPESYPAPMAKKAVPTRKKSIFLFRNTKGQVYATPRDSAFLRGLYHFVEIDAAQKEVMFNERRYKLEDARPISAIRQQYSHFTLEAQVYLLDATGSGKYWHTPMQLQHLPFSKAERKILALLA